MKANYLLFISLLFFLKLNAQSNCVLRAELYGGMTSAYVYSDFDTTSCNPLRTSGFKIIQSYFYIIDEIGCSTTILKWYVVLHENRRLIIDRSYFDRSKVDTAIQRIKKVNPDVSARLKGATLEIERLEAESERAIKEERRMAILEEKRQEEEDLKTLDSLRKSIDKSLATFRSKNWVLWDWSWSYPNEYSSFTDVNVTLINPFKQKVKYIWFTFQAFNPVDDIVRDGISGKSEITVKGIGPIEYGDKATYNFESVFYSKVISTMKIKQIRIQFFDGTFKLVNNPVAIGRDDENE